MVTIIFEAHCTSVDNEARLASGHNDVELSEIGIKQAVELGVRRKDDHFDAILCSDLQRSYKTAELAFGTKFPIVQDPRLRECDYGDLTQKSKELVDAEKPKRIHVPFPGGESIEQTATRMKSFLTELLEQHDGKRVLIIGHRATQYGLEHWINKVPLLDAVTAPWAWRPGWEYSLNNLEDKPTYKYEPKHSLMSESETEFFKQLQRVSQNKYLVFPQIHLSALLDHEIPGQAWKPAFNHINGKSVDYVLCDITTLKPVYAVELDDPTHEREDRINRDAVVEQIFAQANIPLVRFSHYKTLSDDDVEAKFTEAFALHKG